VFQWSPVAVLAVYLAIVIWDLVHGTSAVPRWGFSDAGFRLLVLANFFVWLFAARRFFFDRFRIPSDYGGLNEFSSEVELHRSVRARVFRDWIHFPVGG